MTNVLTWSAPAGAAGAIGSRRLAALRSSHHAMWNYVTYRDAIALVGRDPDDLYPEGTTRLPGDWADLGWLTCFHGPPASALEAMRAALVPDALDVYPPDLIEPLREEAARALGRPRDASFEVVGTEGAQAGLSLALLAAIDPGDEVILGDPGYFHLPAAVLAAGGVPVTVAIGPESGYRLDPDAVAAAITARTRAICLVDPSNPYGTLAAPDEVQALTELAERHGLLLIHDVTHGLLAIEPGAPPVAPPAGEHAVATFSVSHCFGMAGARLGFLAGPPALMRGCLQIKAALTRLNTNLVSQRGALAALRDGAYRDGAQAAIRANLAHLEQTLAGAEGLALAVTPRRGLACAVELTDEGPTAQELMVALFSRRVAVYPGDGLGEERAATTVRLNLSAPTSAMDHLRGALGAALDEAASGRWRAPVAALLDGKGTARAARLADRVRRGR
jgi:aspartate/methionine/tyrosine aminotransferase